MLPLKNLHLRWSQTAAARSLVGPYHGSCVRDMGWGRMTFSSRDRHSSAVVFGGGSWTQTQVMLWDIDLNHQSSPLPSLTMSKVLGSANLANEEMLATNDDMWACASKRWLKHDTMSSQTSIFHTFLGSCLRKVHPSGTSVTSSAMSTPSVVRCCHR